MLHAYFTHNDQLNLLEAANCILCSAIEESRSPVQVMKRIEEVIDDTSLHVKVADFAEQRANNDDTWMFWKQFIFVDCYAYVGLCIPSHQGKQLEAKGIESEVNGTNLCCL